MSDVQQVQDETPDSVTDSVTNSVTDSVTNSVTNSVTDSVTTSVEDSSAEAVPAASDAEKPQDEYIRLRVITTDMANEVHFRVKFSTAFVRLKRSYCARMGLQFNECRFMFDGHRITDTDTPKSLEMTDDDIIELYQERIGGGM